MTDIPAGREMDELVAVHVMKWHKKKDEFGRENWETEDGHWGAGCGRYPEDDDEFLHSLDWHPSESILWAWEVTKKIDAPVAVIQSEIKDGWSAEFYYDAEIIQAIADTPELAICRAALLAVENND